MCKEDNAETKSVPNSGKSSPTSTESTLPEPTTETQTSNSKESTSTITRPLVAVMSQEPSSWILSPEPWTQSELDLSDNSSDLITSCSDSQEQETTGPRVTILKALNLLIQYSTSLEKRLRVVIVYKDSRSPTHSEEVLAQEWEHF